MAKGTWKQGGSGKGSALCKGIDTNKISENMNLIKSNEPEIKNCASCSSFKGINVIGYTICKDGIKFNLNKDKECGEWKWLNG